MKTLIAGTFDHFHVGHQWLIWSAIKQSERVHIIVARDKTVQRIKGFSPKNPEDQRLQRVLLEVSAENHVKAQLGHPEGKFWETVARLNPDKILLGYDQHVKEAEILAHFPAIEVERCTPYKPEIFKSSKFNKTKS